MIFKPQLRTELKIMIKWRENKTNDSCRVKTTWFLTTLKEKSNDISNENILEIEWTAPFDDCDWRDDDFILGGISNLRIVQRSFFRNHLKCWLSATI